MPEILIVDDNPANLVALEAVLESLGERIVKAFDPEVLRAKVASLLSSARRNESLRQEAAERTRERNDLLQREQEARADADVQRQRLQSLFMHSPAAVAVTRGPQHVFTLINPRYQDLNGTRELLGKPGR